MSGFAKADGDPVELCGSLSGQHSEIIHSMSFFLFSYCDRLSVYLDSGSVGKSVGGGGGGTSLEIKVHEEGGLKYLIRVAYIERGSLSR